MCASSQFRIGLYRVSLGAGRAGVWVQGVKGPGSGTAAGLLLGVGFSGRGGGGPLVGGGGNGNPEPGTIHSFQPSTTPDPGRTYSTPGNTTKHTTPRVKETYVRAMVPMEQLVVQLA